MCLLIHFVLEMFMYLLETANSMFLSFIRFELLSFEHGCPISHNMFVYFVALRPKSTAMVIEGWSVHLITLFSGKLEQVVN